MKGIHPCTQFIYAAPHLVSTLPDTFSLYSLSPACIEETCIAYVISQNTHDMYLLYFVYVCKLSLGSHLVWKSPKLSGQFDTVQGQINASLDTWENRTLENRGKLITFAQLDRFDPSHSSWNWQWQCHPGFGFTAVPKPGRVHPESFGYLKTPRFLITKHQVLFARGGIFCLCNDEKSPSCLDSQESFSGPCTILTGVRFV